MEHLCDVMEVFAERSLGEMGIESRMRVGFTDEDEGQVLLNEHFTDRLGRVEIISQNRDLVDPIGGRLLLQPPFRRRVLTVLFRMAILRDDKLGGERNDLILAGRDNHWGKHAMGIRGGAIAMGLA